MKDVMFDLETLGSSPGCAILSIGAVKFDRKKGTLGDGFYVSVDLQSCLDLGLKVEADTFYWWLDQATEARAALLKDRANLSVAIMALNHFLAKDAEGDYCVWSHGASFDLPVLKMAYNACGMTTPWKFRDERDTRTILDLAKMKMEKHPHLAHHALVDAEMQAKTICKALAGYQHA